MRTKLVSVMIAVLCLMAGTAQGYVIDPLIGVEYVQINFGDVEGVWGSAKWLKAQDLLPIKTDGKKMSVAEGYVKMCLKNFEAENLRATLKKCEEASLHLQPGQTLKLFAPVLARDAYNERLTKPLKAEIVAMDREIATIETRNAELKSAFANASDKLQKRADELKMSLMSLDFAKKSRDDATKKANEFGEVINNLAAAFYSSTQQNASLLAQLAAERKTLFETEFRNVDLIIDNPNVYLPLVMALLFGMMLAYGAGRILEERKRPMVGKKIKLKTWDPELGWLRATGVVTYRKVEIKCGCGCQGDDPVFEDNWAEHVVKAAKVRRDRRVKRVYPAVGAA